MESFFRYIAYVDYYRDGDKIRNVGFLRWKLYGDIHSVEIQIKDTGNLAGRYEIQETNTKIIIGEIMIDRGIGSFVQKYPVKISGDENYIETDGKKLHLCNIKGFIIRLNGNEYLSVDMELEKDLQFTQESGQKDIEAAAENVLIEGITEKYVEQKNPIHTDFENEKHIEYNMNSILNKVKVIEPLHEDKWQQLCKDYPKVHPFSEKKTFLSIKPKDFIILQQEYQQLVHNSFLLHGFYNYGHMILGKLAEDEEAPIYIGVPGVYYEREKQAARMFGFVGFESAEHPVQSGSYGYYMIEVKI